MMGIINIGIEIILKINKRKKVEFISKIIFKNTQNQ